MAIKHYDIQWRGTVTGQELDILNRTWPGRFTATETEAEPAAEQVTTKPARGGRTKPARPEE